jgi:hypothetical protein
MGCIVECAGGLAGALLVAKDGSREKSVPITAYYLRVSEAETTLY